MDPNDLKLIRSLPGNDKCFDCGEIGNASWASVSFGTLFCIECSGKHRYVRQLHWVEIRLLQIISSSSFFLSHEMKLLIRLSSSYRFNCHIHTEH